MRLLASLLVSLLIALLASTRLMASVSTPSWRSKSTQLLSPAFPDLLMCRRSPSRPVGRRGRV